MAYKCLSKIYHRKWHFPTYPQVAIWGRQLPEEVELHLFMEYKTIWMVSCCVISDLSIWFPIKKRIFEILKILKHQGLLRGLKIFLMWNTNLPPLGTARASIESTNSLASNETDFAWFWWLVVVISSLQDSRFFCMGSSYNSSFSHQKVAILNIPCIIKVRPGIDSTMFLVFRFISIPSSDNPLSRYEASKWNILDQKTHF